MIMQMHNRHPLSPKLRGPSSIQATLPFVGLVQLYQGIHHPPSSPQIRNAAGSAHAQACMPHASVRPPNPSVTLTYLECRHSLVHQPAYSIPLKVQQIHVLQRMNSRLSVAACRVHSGWECQSKSICKRRRRSGRLAACRPHYICS